MYFHLDFLLSISKLVPILTGSNNWRPTVHAFLQNTIVKNSYFTILILYTIIIILIYINLCKMFVSMWFLINCLYLIKFLVSFELKKTEKLAVMYIVSCLEMPMSLMEVCDCIEVVHTLSSAKKTIKN